MSKVKGLDSKKKPALGELENTLHNIWQNRRDGNMDDFKRLVQEKGKLNEVETESFVNSLFAADKIAYDPEGWLKWIR